MLTCDFNKATFVPERNKNSIKFYELYNSTMRCFYLSYWFSTLVRVIMNSVNKIKINQFDITNSCKLVWYFQIIFEIPNR